VSRLAWAPTTWSWRRSQCVPCGAHARARRVFRLTAAVAASQALQADSLYGHAEAETPSAAAALRHEAYTLLPPVLASLERRRVAGTLLFGACLPHEVAWFEGYLSNNACFHGDPESGHDIAGHFVGYAAYLMAAKLILECLSRREMSPTLAYAEGEAHCAFVLRALELLAAPRPLASTPMGVEGTFALTVQSAVENHGLDKSHSFSAQLTAAWRVVQSGAPWRHGLGVSVEQTTADTLARAARAAADSAARGLRLCAAAGCDAREAHAAHFKSCAACRTVVYCCREHQVADWPSHKKACKAASKTAAEAGAGAGGPGR